MERISDTSLVKDINDLGNDHEVVHAGTCVIQEDKNSPETTKSWAS